jgi:hypothetical protein
MHAAAVQAHNDVKVVSRFEGDVDADRDEDLVHPNGRNPRGLTGRNPNRSGSLVAGTNYTPRSDWLTTGNAMLRLTIRRAGPITLLMLMSPVLAVTSFARSTSPSSGQAPGGSPSPVSVGVAGRSPVGSVFGPLSEWRRNVIVGAQAANSTAMVSGIVKQVQDNYGAAAFNVTQYNTTFYTASPQTVRRDVAFLDCQHKGYIPSQLFSSAHGAHFKAVPIPAQAVPARGDDAELTVWDPAADQLWEFWKAKRTAGGWQACWGGRIDHVSRSPGYFSDGMGATATGLPNAGGMVGISEAEAGRIEHALSLQLVDTESWKIFSYPAQRSDGYNPRRAGNRVPEGTRLRLDPALNVDELHLHPIAKMIAKAAQTYGFIVTDKSGAVAVLAESGAPTKAITGTDPWVALMNGTPSYAIMRGFPWHRLQALSYDYGKP